MPRMKLLADRGGQLNNIVGWWNNVPTTGSPLNVAYRWEHSLRVDWSSPENMWGGGLSNRLYSRYVDQYQVGPNQNMNHMVATYSLVDGYASVKPVRTTDRVVWNQESAQHESAV
jgi:hypothetical protein